MQDLFSVKGKRVLVSGGGSGIGRMISEGYVRAGAKVYITSRDANKLKQCADELNKIGPGECVAMPANLADYDAIVNLVKELEKREKCFHVLVNNAGNNWGQEYSEFPDAAWDRVLGLNVKRVFTLTQKMTPLLLASLGPNAKEDGPWEDPARVIMIGSVDGIRVPSLETYSYSASKAALHQMSRVLAKKLGYQGITVNTLACVMAATLEAAGDAIVANVPLGRIGSLEDVAGACIFLSSKAGQWVNGTIIPLDGGSLVGGKL
ncbi:hypothetical protein OIV83_006228 [Microbotryomycetes sp. JL201]|nr:hypothetical protein OIV83_006228 [Microbotryomycetes sp. JL201]